MIRILYVAVAALLAVFYYYFVGAGPGPSELFEDLEWWRPSGSLIRSDALLSLAELADRPGPERMVPVYLFWLPPLALTIGGLLLFKSAVMRTFFVWLGLVLGAIAYYGILADRVWSFFEWRFPATMASFVAILTVALFAPSLLRVLTRTPRWIAGSLLFALFAGVFLLQTEITGTDANMRFNISPWPVLTVFGMLLFGYCIASLHVAAGLGLWLSSRLKGAVGAGLGALTAAALAALASIYVFSDPPLTRVVLFAVLGAVYMLLAWSLAGGPRTPTAPSGLSRVAAGVLIVVMVGVANQFARANQTAARDETAQVVLLALEEYKKVNQEYPERLKHLVPDYLPELPRPRIGLIDHEDDEFSYSNFGDSYALEFASVQWVQCAYSPPYEFAAYDDDEEYDEEDDGEMEAWEEYDVDVAAGPSASEVEEERALTERLRNAGLEGSWNCPKEPPKIW